MVDLDEGYVERKYHLECRLAGASEFINGMKMVRQADGSVRTAEPVGRAVAVNYKGFDGWTILDSDAPPPTREPAPEPLPPADPEPAPVAVAAPEPEIEIVAPTEAAAAPPAPPAPANEEMF